MSVTATVKVVLEIKASGTWQNDTTIDQIKKQAMDDVSLKIHKALDKVCANGISIKSKPECISINYNI